MIKYDLIMFDIDGTLIDPAEGIKSCLDCAMKRNNLLPSVSTADLYKFIGPPMEQSIKKFYCVDDHTACVIAHQFREYYCEFGYKQGYCYNGIKELLLQVSSLSNIAVITNKHQNYAIKTLEYFGLNIFINRVFSTDYMAHIEKQALIKSSIELFQAKSPVMIGDTLEDFESTNETNCAFIGVTYGYGFTKSMTYKNIITVDSPKQLQQSLITK